ncbi:hypothetical protein MIR68_008965 [Amoeboaphelidium protococcarum]|nr:hypothetical protein MIR68_008965 [Amoeboaphelidium protococcarum]
MDVELAGTALGKQVKESPMPLTDDQNEFPSDIAVSDIDNPGAPLQAELITIKSNGSVENVVKLVRKILKSGKVVYISATEHASYKAVSILQRIKKWQRSSKEYKKNQLESFILISPAQLSSMPVGEVEQLVQSPKMLFDDNSMLIRIQLITNE